jgi:HK97 family phage major capsid protein
VSDYDNLISRANAQPLIPEEVVAEIFQEMPQQSVIMSMARRLPDISRNQTRVKVQSVLPTAYFVDGEAPTGGLKKTTSMEWKNKFLNVEEIAVIVPIPEAVLDDVDTPIWEQVRPKISEAFGKKFDRAVLFGEEAPASWPDDILTGATAAGHTITHGAMADIYDEIFKPGGLKNLLAKDGYRVTGYVGDIEVEALLEGLRDANGQPIYKASMQANQPDTLGGRPLVYPMNGSMDDSQALLFAGDWSKLVWAMRKDMTTKLLTEAVLQDAAGDITHNLAQQDMVAMRFVMRIAWQIPNPVNRMNENDATRYPFSVLLPAA